MKKVIKEIIAEIKETAKDEEFKNKYKEKPTDFIRTRKLSFSLIVMFVLGLKNSCFDFERIHFCEDANINSVSNAALSKARDKIHYSAFRALLSKIEKLIPSKEKIKGYRIIAIDGMKGDLPRTPEFMEKYKPTKRAGYPQFHAVASFDVMNCKFIDAEIKMSTADERRTACDLINKHQQENDILLFDRGFPSLLLIWTLEQRNLKYVARVSKSFLKEVNEFATQKAVDKTIHIDCADHEMKKGSAKEVELPFAFDLRCVKIGLPEGKTEVLITNLSREEFKRKDIGQLYHLRWDIETGFNHLKNAIKIEEFVGIKENSIKQEFYASLIRYNIVMQYVDEAEIVKIWSKKNHKIGV